MKQPPDIQKLEKLLRSSKLVAGGFLGDDRRGVIEIIEADATRLAELGVTAREVAARMLEVTAAGMKGLGTPVRAGTALEVTVDDNRGLMICPWAHPGRYTKTVTTLRNTETGKVLRWSNLSIHLIGEHGFFEGKGSAFRSEPEDLVEMLFG